MIYTSVYIFVSTDWKFSHLSFLILGIPGEPVVVTSEEDIFEYIGYPYKKPSERD
jgi:hypothetical protein